MAAKKKLPLPKYVIMGTKNKGVEMKLDFDNEEYWRDAGMWGVKFKFVKGKLISWMPKSSMPWLHKVPLIKITENEWMEGNKGYV